MNTELGRAFAITPHNTNNLSKKTRGLYVGVAGDVKIDTSNGQTVTLKSLAAGVIHPISANRVYLNQKAGSRGIVMADFNAAMRGCSTFWLKEFTL